MTYDPKKVRFTVDTKEITAEVRTANGDAVRVDARPAKKHKSQEVRNG